MGTATCTGTATGFPRVQVRVARVVPQQRVWGFWWEFKLRLKGHQCAGVLPPVAFHILDNSSLFDFLGWREDKTEGMGAHSFPQQDMCFLQLHMNSLMTFLPIENTHHPHFWGRLFTSPPPPPRHYPQKRAYAHFRRQSTPPPPPPCFTLENELECSFSRVVVVYPTTTSHYPRKHSFSRVVTILYHPHTFHSPWKRARMLVFEGGCCLPHHFVESSGVACTVAETALK